MELHTDEVGSVLTSPGVQGPTALVLVWKKSDGSDYRTMRVYLGETRAKEDLRLVQEAPQIGDWSLHQVPLFR